METYRKKVVVIGLDGVSWDLLNALFSKELLPALKELKENGVHGILESTIPPVTAPAWVSFATGKNPGKHGIYDFVQPRNSLADLKPITSEDIKSVTFYELLERRGKKCILVNMPVTYPPKIKGIVITSFMTRHDFVFPISLRDEIPELKSYRLVPNTRLLVKGRLKEYIQDIRKLENIRFKCTQKLFKHNWDLFFILFSGTDWVNHAIYDKLLKGEENKATEEAIQFYQDIDSYIEWLVKNSPSNTDIIIMSDHGFKSYVEIFFINEWLRRKGYLNVTVASQFEENTYPHKFSEGVARSKKQVRVPLIITKLALVAHRFFPSNIIYSLYTRIRKYLPFYPVFTLTPNFRRTIAYCISSESRGIYLNTKERFNDGTIKSTETLKIIREKIINELKQLKDHLNEPLFKAVLQKEYVYGYAPFLDNAPDIILIPNKCILTNYLAPVTLSKIKSFNNDHDLYGIFIANGSDIKVEKASIYIKIVDLAPTILHLFGLPIPSDMDGRVLMEIFEPDSEPAKRKPVYVDLSYYQKPKTEKERIREKVRRLKGLTHNRTS